MTTADLISQAVGQYPVDINLELEPNKEEIETTEEWACYLLGVRDVLAALNLNYESTQLSPMYGLFKLYGVRPMED